MTTSEYKSIDLTWNFALIYLEKKNIKILHLFYIIYVILYSLFVLKTTLYD